MSIVTPHSANINLRVAVRPFIVNDIHIIVSFLYRLSEVPGKLDWHLLIYPHPWIRVG